MEEEIKRSDNWNQRVRKIWTCNFAQTNNLLENTIGAFRRWNFAFPTYIHIFARVYMRARKKCTQQSQTLWPVGEITYNVDCSQVKSSEQIDNNFTHKHTYINHCSFWIPPSPLSLFLIPIFFLFYLLSYSWRK